jgi:hypothetical protein
MAKKKTFKAIRKESSTPPNTSAGGNIAGLPPDDPVVGIKHRKKKKKKKKKDDYDIPSMEDLIKIPEGLEDDDFFSKKIVSVHEMEESMRDIHGINSMKDLRPDDYKGFSVNVLNLFNKIKKRKG